MNDWAKPNSWVLEAFMRGPKPLINTCENSYFRDLCRSLNKDAEFFGRGRITAARMRHLLSYKLLGKAVALTTDHWTSVANQSYLAITAHWMDENWDLQYCTGELVQQVLYLSRMKSGDSETDRKECRNPCWLLQHLTQALKDRVEFRRTINCCSGIILPPSCTPWRQTQMVATLRM
jgi:hypothetical protein